MNAMLFRLGAVVVVAVVMATPAPPDLRVGDLVTFDIVIDPPSPPHGELATSVTRLSAGTVIT